MPADQRMASAVPARMAIRSDRAKFVRGDVRNSAMGAEDAGIGPIQPEPGEGHLHRTDGRNDFTLLPAEVLDHIPRETVQSRISADQHGNPLPGGVRVAICSQQRGDIGLDEDSLRGAIGKQFQEAFAAHEDVGPGDRLPRGLGDIQWAEPGPQPTIKSFGRIHCHGVRSPSVPRHSPAMSIRNTATAMRWAIRPATANRTRLASSAASAVFRPARARQKHLRRWCCPGPDARGPRDTLGPSSA